MLQLLQELLDLSNNDQILNENWGNLNFVDKKFKNLFKFGDSLNYKSSSKTNELNKTAGVPLSFGSDAIVNEKDFKTNSELQVILEDDIVKMVLIESNGTQVCLIRKYQADFSTPPKMSFELFVDTQTLIDNVKEDNQQKFSDLLHKAEFIETQEFKHYSTAKVYDNIKTVSQSKINSQTNILLKLLKETTLYGQLKAYAISNDDRRLVKRKERYAAKKIGDEFVFDFEGKPSKMPLQLRPGHSKPVADNLYHDAVQKALMSRLNEYKKNKADDVTLEEMLDLIKAKGFLKYLKVKGVPYTLYDMDYMSMSNFTDNTRSRPSISYKVNDQSPEYEKFKKKAQLLKNLYDDNEEEEFRKAYAKFMPPYKIRLELAFGPGGIVPVNVAESNW
jgi:hypothetical protein